MCDVVASRCPGVGLAACVLLAALRSVPAPAQEVWVAVGEDNTKQTKYDVTVKNTGTAALIGIAARVYVDLGEAHRDDRNSNSSGRARYGWD